MVSIKESVRALRQECDQGVDSLNRCMEQQIEWLSTTADETMKAFMNNSKTMTLVRAARKPMDFNNHALKNTGAMPIKVCVCVCVYWSYDVKITYKTLLTYAALTSPNIFYVYVYVCFI